ncbi:MAG: HD domain-containing protein [Lachnospiraceae bacterium]|nr:HD domain-containing protein [Lachnospiraceae bacterium]
MNITPDLKRILDIAVSLTAEKKYSKLLEKLISECMEITNCDAGTLYILKDDKLEFMILRNNTMNVYKGGNGEPIDSMPPVILNEKYVCAYSAIKKTTINVKNVYDDSQFDWQGPRKYDSISGYHTESMLVVPLINHDDKVIGVLQLINAKDKAGNTIGFSEDNETIVFSISSEAAISLSNMILLKQLRDMLYSFVSSLTTAIDQRTPYNANHSYNVARYCDEFAKYIMRDERPRTDFEYITDSEREQLVMAALVHDVGKLITPIEIMNKPDRLDFRLPIMEMRWKYLNALLKLEFSDGLLSKEEYDAVSDRFEKGKELIRTYNTAGFLDEEKLSSIKALKSLYATDRETNEKIELLTDDELHEMMIVKGTLTAEERKIIEMHAVYTDRILSKISFQDDFKLVRVFAAAHHEYLDGSGYPNGLTAKDLPLEVRIMTIADIYDSLTADDRPYKKAVPVQKALSILTSMADEGKLDKTLTEQFCSYIYEATSKEPN